MRLSYAVLFFMMTLSLYAQETLSVDTIAHVPYATVDVKPQYQGCANTKDIGNRQFTVDRIEAFIYSNFNRQKLKRTDRKFAIHFLITSRGKISNISVSTRHQHLIEEARRVVSLLPKFIPGKQRGKTVGVFYGLTLDFSEKTDKALGRNKS